ncbi:hypothetical protein M426DRAFT_325633 [Hypoxylon sp. CI-4A]|nr:hypothetical protein M426DRAFT_325633 [Hypoxylon sp. CI-4A]
MVQASNLLTALCSHSLWPTSSSHPIPFPIPKVYKDSEWGWRKAQCVFGPSPFCPSNPASLVLPLLYILRYADVHLPPTYLRFPLAAPRYHIHGPNKTYTPPPLPKPDPSICFLASLQRGAIHRCSSIRRRVVSTARPFAFCRRLQQGFF